MNTDAAPSFSRVALGSLAMTDMVADNPVTVGVSHDRIAYRSVSTAVAAGGDSSFPGLDVAYSTVAVENI